MKTRQVTIIADDTDIYIASTVAGNEFKVSALSSYAKNMLLQNIHTWKKNDFFLTYLDEYICGDFVFLTVIDEYEEIMVIGEKDLTLYKPLSEIIELISKHS